jgi:hypothetical protein
MIRTRCSSASARYYDGARAWQRNLRLSGRRVAYMGAEFGSATRTSGQPLHTNYDSRPPPCSSRSSTASPPRRPASIRQLDLEHRLHEVAVSRQHADVAGTVPNRVPAILWQVRRRAQRLDFGKFRLPWGVRHCLLVVLGYSRLLWISFVGRQDMRTLFSRSRRGVCLLWRRDGGSALRPDEEITRDDRMKQFPDAATP